MAVIAHYINRGQRLDDLLALTTVERLFFLAAWELEAEGYGE